MLVTDQDQTDLYRLELIANCRSIIQPDEGCIDRKDGVMHDQDAQARLDSSGSVVDRLVCVDCLFQFLKVMYGDPSPCELIPPALLG